MRLSKRANIPEGVRFAAAFALVRSLSLRKEL